MNEIPVSCGDGESVLLKLMNQETDANYKLKTAIVRALASADIQSTNIDFIIENFIMKMQLSYSVYFRM
mgnify:CR=1 FL=1